MEEIAAQSIVLTSQAHVAQKKLNKVRNKLANAKKEEEEDKKLK